MIPILPNHRNPKVYNDPDTFDAWRYFRMRRDKSSEAKAQLTTPTVDHMGFGLGQHACPGRFLAANEIKTTLCHMLLKYEWRFPEGQSRPGSFQWETELLTNPKATLQIRRREEEMIL
jgi:cytochrome P450